MSNVNMAAASIIKLRLRRLSRDYTQQRCPPVCLCVRLLVSQSVCLSVSPSVTYVSYLVRNSPRAMYASGEGLITGGDHTDAIPVNVERKPAGIMSPSRNTQPPGQMCN